MIKKILLLEVPTTRLKEYSADKVRIAIVPPIGIAYLAAVLEKEGYNVKIIDCLLEGYKKPKEIGERIRYGLSDEEIKKKIKKYSPDIVGVSCLFSNKYRDAHNLCKLTKEVDKNLITVMGGPHVTAVPEEVLKDKNVDFIILGEGEYSFLDLINALNENKVFSKVDGIGYRENGVIKIIPKTEYIKNLDELPLPARHLLKMDEYCNTESPHSGIKRRPFATITTSRGCPFRCSFCAIRKIWGLKYRTRSAESVLDEIGMLVKKYGIRELHFEDDNFAFDKERATKILDGIVEHGFALTLNSPSGLALATLDDGLIEKMVKAGYYSISIAVESGDPYVLHNLMHKPVVLEKVKPLVKKARSIGLNVKGFFMLGYPGETKGSMQRTVEFASKAGFDWTIFFITTLLPGTDMYKTCIEKGYVRDPNMDWELNFIKGNIKTPEFTPEYVENLREKANFEINFKNNINLREKKWDRAIEDFAYIVNLYPHLDFAHFYLGNAYEGKGFIEKAKKEWRKVLVLNPNYREAQQCLDKYS